MNKQEASQTFQKELLEKVRETVFVSSNTSTILLEEYAKLKNEALRHVSFAYLQSEFQLSFPDYKTLLDKSEAFTLMEVHIINTLLSSMKPKDLEGITTLSYTSIIDLLMRLGDEYNNQIQPVTDSIQRKINIMSGGRHFKSSNLQIIQ